MGNGHGAWLYPPLLVQHMHHGVLTRGLDTGPCTRTTHVTGTVSGCVALGWRGGKAHYGTPTSSFLAAGCYCGGLQHCKLQVQVRLSGRFRPGFTPSPVRAGVFCSVLLCFPTSSVSSAPLPPATYPTRSNQEGAFCALFRFWKLTEFPIRY